MKKYIAIALLLILVTAYPAYARWSVGTAGGGAAAAAAPTTACTGYSTNCAFNTAVSSEISSSAARAEVNHWVASTNGTAVAVKIFCGNHTEATNVTVGYWVDGQLRGQSADIGSTCEANTQSWQRFTLSSYSGRSLNFSSSDNIRYGIHFDTPTGNNVNITYGDGDNVAHYSRYEADYPQDTATWSDLGTNEQGWGLIFEYTY